MPDFSNVQLFEWLINNGVAVAFLFVMVYTLGRQISSAITYFTNKLDAISQQNTEAAGKLTDAVTALSTSAAQNNEALKLVMLFISQNMQQVVAHRESVEGKGAASIVPGPQINMPGSPTQSYGAEQSKTDN